MSILTKKSFTKLFGITQTWNESTRTYLKIFNKEMLKIEELIEPVAFETFINGVREKAFVEVFVRSTRLKITEG
jgi:hypothetical protein